MNTLAAVLEHTSKPLTLADIEIPALKPGQVLVEIAFSGMCHTQVLECRGDRGPDAFLPHCLGHEGSGIVREVGAGVTKCKSGQNVMLSWMKGSGMDVPATLYRWADRSVNSGAITTFSRFSVISENRISVLPDGFSLKDAALIGCTVATGLGSVFNTAAARPAQSLAVFGVGGVGLCAIAAAENLGCSPIVAVDTNPHKLKQATIMGATHTVLISNNDPVKEIQKICPPGVDVAIEASGQTAAMKQVLQSVRGQGGNAVIVGNAREGSTLEIDPKEFNKGKRLLGSWGGDNIPDRDFPRYLDLIKRGELRLDVLTTKTYSLAQVNEALTDLEKGLIVRPLIDMHAA